MNKVLAWALKFGSSTIGKLLIKIGTSIVSKALEVVYPIVKDAVAVSDEVYKNLLMNEH